MKIHFCKKLFLLTVLMFQGTLLFGLSVPSLNNTPLHDYARLFTPEEATVIKERLLEIDARKNYQLAVLTVESLEGDVLEEYATRVFGTWGLGDASKNNGVLILVAFAERSIRIEVGYGLESVITDARAGMIIRNFMVPAFQKERYGEAILSAITLISDLVEEDGQLFEEMEKEDPAVGYLGAALLASIIFGCVGLGKLGGASSGSGSRGRSYSSGGGGGGYSGGSSYSGGGGSSGGGGASGRW